MRLYWGMRAILAMLAGALVGNHAPAQGMDPFGMMSKPPMLLVRVDIKKEMKLSKEQSKQIESLNREFQEALKGGSKDLSSGMAVFKVIDEIGERMLKVLDDDQRKRLREIRIQSRGPSALLDDDVREELVLTPEQTQTIEAARTEARNAALVAARAGKADGKALDKIGKVYEDAVMKSLTVGQSEKFKALQGKPFPNARLKGMPVF